MWFYHGPRAPRSCRRHHFQDPPGTSKFIKNAPSKGSVQKFATMPSKGGHCAQICANGSTMEGNCSRKGGKMEPRASPKSHFLRKRPTLSSTHYLLCIIHISPSEHDTFLLPGATENGWIPWFSFPNARKPLKTAAGDPKSAPPGGTWRPQGSQWAPKCLPNATQNHQKMASCVQPPPEDH